MSNSDFLVQSFIDIALWDRAGWRGVAWMWPPNSPPGMGLLFGDHGAGTEIFLGWKQRLGDHDNRELLRVSVIEGAIPGADPGYNVRIGTNIAHLLETFPDAKKPGTAVLTASRIHRMNPSPASPNLAKFKQAFETHGRYAIVQVVPGDRPGGISPVYETAIMKTEVFFRQIEGIEKGDPDSDAVRPPRR